MIRFNQLQANLHPEQKALLQNCKSFQHLGTSPPMFSFSTTLNIVWLPLLIFIFALVVLTSIPIRYTIPGLALAICIVGLCVMLIYPALSMGSLVFAVVTAKFVSWDDTRVSAIVYWSYWPMWKGTMCWMAMLFGCLLGNHLWYNQIYPHTRIHRLQAYQEIDPARVGGVRLQDAGIVRFTEAADVDRLSIGCLKDKSTYCVAPILNNSHNLKETNYQQYDFFMAGTDCCACPGEFRCGDWDKASQLGGLRIIDSDARDFYKLAIEDWAAAYGKTTAHPIFLHWAHDPVAANNEIEDRGWRFFVLALLAAPSMFVLMALVLQGIFRYLCEEGFAVRESLVLPSDGVAHWLCVRFVPDMHKHSVNTHTQLETPLTKDPNSAKSVYL